MSHNMSQNNFDVYPHSRVTQTTVDSEQCVENFVDFKTTVDDFVDGRTVNAE